MPSTIFIHVWRAAHRMLSVTAVLAAVALVGCAEEAIRSSPSQSLEVIVTGTPAPSEPLGVLTYVRDGQYASVPVTDPARLLASTAVGPGHHVSAHDRPTAIASPDGRYEARLVTDAQEMRIEVTTGGHVAQSIPIAAAEGVDLVALGKGSARAVEGVPLTMAWSPDSKHLAFGSVTGAPWTLNIFDLRTWSFANYQVEGGYVGELAWSPDSARLAISTYQLERTNHTVLVLDMEAAAVRRLIGGCIAVWSPDSNFVAVRREPLEEPGVWIASIEGRTEIRVTADSKSYPVAWTFDSPSPANRSE